jgi:uncharacterized membrane protein
LQAIRAKLCGSSSFSAGIRKKLAKRPALCYAIDISARQRRAREGFALQDSQRQEFIRELLEDTDREFSDEELLHMLIRKKISADTSAAGEKTTFGQRAADNVAKFAGSWGFIFSFLGVMFVWMVLNILMAAKAFDPYPFILLNLLLSCIAAVQAPLIMMSQNRQEAKDRERAENDYRVNLKTELLIDDLHLKIDRILENQDRLLQKPEQE